MRLVCPVSPSSVCPQPLCAACFGELWSLPCTWEKLISINACVFLVLPPIPCRLAMGSSSCPGTGRAAAVLQCGHLFVSCWFTVRWDLSSVMKLEFANICMVIFLSEDVTDEMGDYDERPCWESHTDTVALEPRACELCTFKKLLLLIYFFFFSPGLMSF